MDRSDDIELDEQHLGGVSNFPLARRGFMMTSLISGFTMATTVVHAQAIHTDDDGLDAGMAQIDTAGGQLPGYYAHPKGNGPFPTIIVIEEIFGVHEYIKDVCRRLAKLGYLAVAPELYARIADLSKMSNPQEIMSNVIQRAPDQTMLNDLDATVFWAAGHGGDAARLGVLGFCRGGRDAWMFAGHNPHLKAAVVFYGPLNSPTSPIQPRTAMDYVGQIKCPVLAMYGAKDQSIPVADVQTAERIAKASHEPTQFIIYPDAGHGFHADYRPSYNQHDAQDAWEHATAWFKKYVLS